MEKLLLVDGHNLLFQMFFGMPTRITGKNEAAIQGVVGFTGALLKTIRQLEITKALVVFDNENGSTRCETDSSYKANRTDFTFVPDEENPFSQYPDIKRVLDFLNIRHFETEAGYEADDLISGYCRKYSGVAKIIILSQDSDYYQLIDEYVSVYKYRGKKSQLIGSAEVMEKLGVMPFQVAEYKALTGDTCDNIRGVPRIGPKTAARLLNEHGCIHNIFNGLDNIKPIYIQNALRENVDLIERNFRIIRLSGEVNLPLNIEDIGDTSEALCYNTMDALRRTGVAAYN